MAETTSRPSGLTVLAVVNFFLILGNLASIVGSVILLEAVFQKLPNELQEELLKAREALGPNVDLVMYVMIAASLLVAALLLFSGIGYLKQKKFMGRTLGNTYAIFSILALTTISFLVPGKMGEFSLGTILNLIYPVLTLFLLNVIFKEDFIN